MIGGRLAAVPTAVRVTRALGPDWVAFRVLHALRLKTGRLERRLPMRPWEGYPLAAELADPALTDPAAYLTYRREQAPAFFFPPDGDAESVERLRTWDGDGAARGPVAVSEALADGWLPLFGRDVTVGWPVDWSRNVATGELADHDRHWSRVGDFAGGDIKGWWEPSRFGVAYALVRAHRRTGDDLHAARFWALFEGWRVANPPYGGLNWRCGQETSLRAMAWCFALYGLLAAPSTTAERVASLVQAINLSGQRVAATLDYARSQRNNHGVSEAVGLFTIGSLFPELRAAAVWRATGRRALEEELRTLILPDGSFSQHSTNYQRVMLDAAVWALRLAQLHGEPFSAEATDQVRRATALLHALQDETTGRLPNYGPNDGAWVLPLANTDARDFRPAVQAAWFLTTGRRAYGDGPWDEPLWWLFGEPATRTPVCPPPHHDLAAEAGGYFTLRAPSGFAFVRCPPRFRFRPGHADLLHVDLWWRGLNVALDPGTYSYNAPPPWESAFSGTGDHNCVAVDGRDQMDRVGRFLWLPWPRGHVAARRRSLGGRLTLWEGGHDGYRRLPEPVSHRRAILRLADEHWLVLDDLVGGASHAARLHWLLPDMPHGGLTRRADGLGSGVELTTPAGAYALALGTLGTAGETTLVRADPEGTRGWLAPGYLDRGPALSIALTARGERVRFWSLLGPPQATMSAAEDGSVTVRGDGWTAEVMLGGEGRAGLVRAAVWRGEATGEEDGLVGRGVRDEACACS